MPDPDQRPLAEARDSDSGNSLYHDDDSKPVAPLQLMATEDNLDALAALSYLDEEPTPVPSKPKAVDSPKLTTVVENPVVVVPPPDNADGVFKSSFAPSKQAAERKARSEAQQAAHHAAVHRPGGRLNGKRRARNENRGPWSSDEEDEDEEDDDDDDDDADSDLDPSAAGSSRQSSRHNAALVPPSISVQPLHISPRTSSPLGSADGHSHLRPPRILPQIPGRHTGKRIFGQ
jgi:CCR4-NOT transcriptional complex subunit CAF120